MVSTLPYLIERRAVTSICSFETGFRDHLRGDVRSVLWGGYDFSSKTSEANGQMWNVKCYSLGIWIAMHTMSFFSNSFWKVVAWWESPNGAFPGLGGLQRLGHRQVHVFGLCEAGEEQRLQKDPEAWLLLNMFFGFWCRSCGLTQSPQSCF